ncbi:hypothetical protein FJU08_17440 [Martelella alba]|uniref:Uncharacterized protein n=1 Tax=Martelella alba TaxID=2590451 RepID=A0A506U9T3_9HYPH|nr:hypothetical protein [Martelella alba]TPW28587.1 hypothetical protein FJU08_17440 [Martelella alba]
MKMLDNREVQDQFFCHFAVRHDTPSSFEAMAAYRAFIVCCRGFNVATAMQQHQFRRRDPPSLLLMQEP